MDCIRPATFLLPTGIDLTKWACIACDQHSANADYWNHQYAQVADAPSTLHLILPEVFLGEDEATLAARMANISNQMKRYLDSSLLQKYRDCAVYLERTTSVGKLRKSLIVEVDLESYSYTHPETARIRPSEATVPERIPPRLKVRRGAALETSHVQLLFDDPENTVFDLISKAEDSLPQLYDFALPAGGGHVKGFALVGHTALWQKILTAFDHLQAPQKYGYDFLVGDGNHSLATAKAYWQELKAGGAPASHPARYALVELINLHDPGLEFEPIHRLLQGVSWTEFIQFARSNLAKKTGEIATATALGQGTQAELRIPCQDDLPLNVLQEVLDLYLKEFHPDNPQCLEYIHGADELRRLAQLPGNVGILVPALPRQVLFPYVAQHGATARKTFSLGHAADKRYYLEVRDIRG